MKKGLTELVFIIDRSGSMQGLENDTIGGFNAMLKEQQAIEGEAVVTTVLFDDQYELLHDRIDIRAVAPLNDKDYTVRGSTALLDAVGKTIKKVRMVQRHTAEDYRAEKVMFVIITDGEENASREYSADRVKKRIERQKQKYGWEFIFFGANIDAVAEAGKLGIAANRAMNYHADSRGTQSVYTSMSVASTSFRKGKVITGLEDYVGSKDELLDGDTQEQLNEAMARIKNAVDGMKEDTDEIVDFVKVVEANDGKIPDVNEIARKILGY